MEETDKRRLVIRERERRWKGMVKRERGGREVREGVREGRREGRITKEEEEEGNEGGMYEW